MTTREYKYCTICGQKYEPSSANQMTCSDKCSIELRKERNRLNMRIKRTKSIKNTTICVMCGKEFEKHTNAMTCSEECSKALKAQRNKEYFKAKRAMESHSYNELSPSENRKFLQQAEENQKKRTKCIFSLDEKSKICKDYGLSYAQMQVIVDASGTREEAENKLYQIRRKKFMELSEQNAN